MWGKHHSEKTKNLIRQKALGRKLSKETKEKISKATKGDNNPRAKKVLCIETNQIFNTAKEAAEWIKRDNSTLCKACKNNRPCGGYHWKYI